MLVLRMRRSAVIAMLLIASISLVSGCQPASSQASIDTASPNCPVSYSYNDLVNGGKAWTVVDLEEDQNSTSDPASATFISRTATTVSMSASLNIGIDVDAILAPIFASVHAQINASVSRSTTTDIGNRFGVTVPAGKTAYGIYGVQEQITSGNLSGDDTCSGGKTDYGTVSTYVPISPGWCVWVSGQPPCVVLSSGSQGGGSDAATVPPGPLWSLADTLADPRAGNYVGVDGVAFDPSSGQLAAGDNNGNIYVWNPASGQLAATLIDQTGASIISVAFDPANSLLAAADYIGAVNVWNVAGKSVIASVTDPSPGKDGINQVAFSHDGSVMATADSNGNTYLWSTSTWQLEATLHDLRPGSFGVGGVAIAPDDSTVATIDSNGNTYIWSTRTWSLVKTLSSPGSTRCLGSTVTYTRTAAHSSPEIAAGRPACGRRRRGAARDR